jgi:hypothetical protein
MRKRRVAYVLQRALPMHRREHVYQVAHRRLLRCEHGLQQIVDCSKELRNASTLELGGEGKSGGVGRQPG